MSHASAMIVTEAELLARVAADREAGQTIALANGCFDILHVGHVRYLDGAAREADRLVVAVRSAAAWRGVEVQRIRRDDQMLRVLGTDRMGRAVTLVMSCDDLGYVCKPSLDGRGFAAVAQ